MESREREDATRGSLYLGGLGLICAHNGGGVGAGNQDLRRAETA